MDFVSIFFELMSSQLGKQLFKMMNNHRSGLVTSDQKSRVEGALCMSQWRGKVGDRASRRGASVLLFREVLVLIRFFSKTTFMRNFVSWFVFFFWFFFLVTPNPCSLKYCFFLLTLDSCQWRTNFSLLVPTAADVVTAVTEPAETGPNRYFSMLCFVARTVR